jgi:glycogen synthase
MTGLRVLLVPSAYLPNVGGIEEVTRRLAAGLRERGNDVIILTNRWPDDTLVAERIEGVEVTRIPFHLPAANGPQLARFALRAPGSAVRLLRLSRRLRPDVVHVIGAGPNAAYVAALNPLLRAAVVLSAHGELSGDAHNAFERSSTLRRALRALCASADAVTTPSAYTLEELKSTFPIRARAEVIPNGVDVEEFAGAEPRDDLGRYVLTVGRLVQQKGLDTLLDAFARTRDRLDGRRLVIAGEGPDRAKLEARAAELGIADTVVFLGLVSRASLPALFAAADAFVLASRREAFGLVALEAMAAGVPLVATTVGGVPEIATDGQSGLLVAPGDPDALGAALVRLLSEPDLRSLLAEGGRARAREHSWARAVDAYEALYREVIR